MINGVEVKIQFEFIKRHPPPKGMYHSRLLTADFADPRPYQVLVHSRASGCTLVWGPPRFTATWMCALSDLRNHQSLGPRASGHESQETSQVLLTLRAWARWRCRLALFNMTYGEGAQPWSLCCRTFMSQPGELSNKRVTPSSPAQDLGDQMLLLGSTFNPIVQDEGGRLSPAYGEDPRRGLEAGICLSIICSCPLLGAHPTCDKVGTGHDL